jgi:hypothetical protein
MNLRVVDGRLQAPKEVLAGNPLRCSARLTKVTMALPDGPLVLTDLVGPLRGTIFSLDDHPGYHIVNGVNAVDLITTGRATLDAEGLLVLLLSGADNVALNPNLKVERHGVRIVAPYSLVPALSAVWELEVHVRNLATPTP